MKIIVKGLLLNGFIKCKILFSNCTQPNQIVLNNCKPIELEVLLILGFPYQGPVVQSIVSVTSSLMADSLTVVAKVFSNKLIFLLHKCE